MKAWDVEPTVPLDIRIKNAVVVAQLTVVAVSDFIKCSSDMLNTIQLF